MSLDFRYASDVPRIYRPNPKHKIGACGEGPPRWFPSRDSLCPEDVDLRTAQQLLDAAIPGTDPVHLNQHALYALHNGEFYKAYSECSRLTDEGVEEELWHGYPVRRELVPRQVPARVLRKFVEQGRLTRAEYKRLLGSAP